MVSIIRRLAPVLLALLTFGVSSLPAQESGVDAGLPRPAEARSSSFTRYAETNVQLDVGFFGIYLAAEPHVIWRARRFGAGVGVKLLAGATQLDLHAAPFVRVELWWLYANAGWTVELASRTDRYQAVGNGLFTAAGIAPDLIGLGHGRLGVDLGLEFYLPARGNEPSAPVAALVQPWGLPYAVSSILESVLGTGFVRMGVLYTFPL